VVAVVIVVVFSLVVGSYFNNAKSNFQLIQPKKVSYNIKAVEVPKAISRKKTDLINMLEGLRKDGGPFGGDLEEILNDMIDRIKNAKSADDVIGASGGANAVELSLKNESESPYKQHAIGAMQIVIKETQQSGRSSRGGYLTLLDLFRHG
jgi:hypothetical protein